MRILITGGCGFIGAHLVGSLLAAGHVVHVIDDFSSAKPSDLRCETAIHLADIRDSESLAAAFERLRPHAVVHLAAQISVSRSVRESALDADVNILGTISVLAACARHKVPRIVFASSGGVLYGETTTPANETSECRPASPYGIAKWSAERYLEWHAREHGVRAVSLRYSNVYGPRQNPHGEAGVVAILTQRMLEGRPPIIFGDGSIIRDFIYVSDVVRACQLAVETDLPKGFLALNISTGRGTTVLHLANELQRRCDDWLARSPHGGSVPPLQFGPPRSGDLQTSILDPGLAARVLGWKAEVPLSDGLDRTVEWFATTGAERVVGSVNLQAVSM